jgi:hypothetical protein
MRTLLTFAFALATLPVLAAGPAQGPIQGPTQAPNKAMMGNAPAVAQSNTRRAYSYEPADTAAGRTYSYAPGYSYAPRYFAAPRYSPQAFMRTERVKTAAFKSVQQYGD